MPGVPILLFLLFLGLKLGGVIAWSWLWVTAPLWVPVVVVVGFFLVALIFGAAATGIFAAAKPRKF